MLKTFKKLSILLVIISLTGCAVKNPPQTMSNVNIQRYLGTWYEIASLPAPFQRNCYCTTAQYHLVQGKFSITNSCRKGSVSGELDVAHASAKVIPNTGNSQLKVTFFWPFSGPYWILYVSPNYQTAVVGTPDRKYLWLLARQKTISEKAFNQLKNIAIERGYHLKNLNKTKQCLSHVKRNT